MCGILGFIALGDKKPDVEQFKKALVDCSKRGTDATGFYSERTGIVKKDAKAEDFIKLYTKELDEAMQSNVVLSHCRYTTKGPEEVNVNNHPHESENYILVHNGTISRTEKIKDYKYNSECDSEIILSYLEKEGSVKKGVESMIGYDSMAIMVYHKKEKKVYLFRNTNPTHLIIDKKDKIIYVASTIEIVRNFYRYKKVLGFSLWDELSSFETDKDKLYTFDLKDGLTGVEEIKQKVYVYSSGVNNWGNDEYSSSRYGCGYGWQESQRGSSHAGFSGYQNSSLRKEYCTKCHDVHIGANNQCTRVQTPTVTADKTNNKTVERRIIYRGGRPQFINFTVESTLVT